MSEVLVRAAGTRESLDFPPSLYLSASVFFTIKGSGLYFVLLRVQTCKEKAEAETVLETREHLAR